METMRPDTIHPAPPAAPTPPQVPGADVLSELLGRSPSDCPEVLRCMAMTRGTLDTTAALLAELEHRLSHVLLLGEPRVIEPNGNPPVVTAAGQYADAMFDDAQRVTDRVRDLLNRLAGV